MDRNARKRILPQEACTQGEMKRPLPIHLRKVQKQERLVEGGSGQDSGHTGGHAWLGTRGGFWEPTHYEHVHKLHTRD